MLVDSNILVYALNRRSQKYLIARKFLLANYKELYISQQNILETLRVVTHPKYPNPLTSRKVIKEIEKFISQFNFISAEVKSLFYTFDLIEEHKLRGNKIFDAYLVATMLTNEIYSIATDNVKDFKNYKGIEVFNPFVNEGKIQG